MKKCPQCGTTYTDESLRFCLADGAALDSGEEPTVVSGRGSLRVDIGSGNRTSGQVSEPTKKSSSAFVKTILVLSVLVALAVVVIVAAVGVLYLQSLRSENKATNIQTTTPSPTPTPDPETERLKKELADLQKQLDEKKSTAANKDAFPDIEDLDI